MKIRIVKICLVFTFLGFMVSSADAQRTGRRRNQPANQQRDSVQQQQQVNNTNAPVNYNPYAGIPIRVDTVGMADTVFKKSLRNDNAFDKSVLSERTPLAYEHLRWDDALFAHKVWRELDLREKINMPFRYDAQDDNGSQIFVDILLRAVRSGGVTAFGDDRFSTPLSLDELNQVSAGTADTVPVTDPDDINKIIEYKVTRAAFDSRSVNKIAIKEEWVFDREASRLFVRILGIAPLQTKYLPNGQERGYSVMFWVYYPDLRPTLAKYEVYNSKNMGNMRMTWEELFESRMFSSYIVKSTVDNPLNRPIRGMIRDQILALLEGENVKEKIFNYEQNLWSY